ncbi:hypothetical protein BCR33DRAFT_856501 [Rhizoclosmatium globosum]|uniref:Potassium channel domain-containing protein n=1 Tax=Rhizoclosmatium globosum TaxID=329046 RepID=A0A1Y2BCG7_9FUNG|nr:hypothetical protein BCR33DRAFT_856501 [Rhizoclosmatium globosum]|eukprot:ORY32406.1 hypothetical protein BCR33DRAFT_856501 [Rhizoclosmatium globosum]
MLHSSRRHAPLYMAMLVPVATFLNIQSLTVPLAPTYANVGNAEAPFSSKPHPSLTASYVALAFGLLATVSDFLRMLEKKIKWTTRLLIFGSVCQGIINLTVVLVYGWNYLGSFEVATTENTDGMLFTFLSASTSLLAAYFCFRELKINEGEDQVYVFLLNSLSANQRQLTILSILSMAFIVVSGAAYSYLEDWDLNEAQYFIVVMATSIGFGDLSPSTPLGKFFLFAFAPIGLGLVGLNIFAMREVLLEMFTLELADTFSKKFGMKQEHHHGYSLDDSVLSYGRRMGSETLGPSQSIEIPRSPNMFSGTSSSAPGGLPSLDALAALQPLNTSSRASSSLSLLPPSPGPSFASVHCPPRTMTLSRGGVGTHVTLMGDSQIRRKMVVNATKEIYTSQIKQAIIMVSGTMILFATVFSYLEGWSFWDGIYFTFCTLTTIGFGDFAPSTPLTRSLFIWFVLTGIVNVTYLGSMLGERILNQWTVTVGLIEDRMGRYEVKARIKRDWGSRNNSSRNPSASPEMTAAAEPAAPPPRIIHISSPVNKLGTSLPTRFWHGRRQYGLVSDLDTDVEDELSDSGSEGDNVVHMEPPQAPNIPDVTPSTSIRIQRRPLVTSPTEDCAPMCSPAVATRASSSASIRIFSAKPKRKGSKANTGETDSFLG